MSRIIFFVCVFSTVTVYGITGYVHMGCPMDVNSYQEECRKEFKKYGYESNIWKQEYRISYIDTTMCKSGMTGKFEEFIEEKVDVRYYVVASSMEEFYRMTSVKVGMPYELMFTGVAGKAKMAAVAVIHIDNERREYVVYINDKNWENK